MSGRSCDLCGAPTPYTDWNVCESCRPLNAIGREREWQAAKAAVAFAVAAEREACAGAIKDDHRYEYIDNRRVISVAAAIGTILDRGE